MLNLKDATLLRQQVLLAGEWIDADTRETIPVLNPATGERIGTVPMCGTEETRRAIAAAEAAQRAWARRPAKERTAILRKLNDLMLANQDDLALIMTAEQGKPLTESKGEIAYAPRSSTGSRTRHDASTATPFPPLQPTAAFSRSSSPLA
jgi:succinate-semialdehyde dehydrogenase/glutarate-semialdehyde dehydrogenase